MSDKTGIADFGRGLIARGFTLVSTGGTLRALTDAGLAAVSVSDVTGFPEMMDGRVKTLHPAVHGGILARRDRPDHLAAAAAQGIGLVDLVVVNLYPFEAAASNPSTPFDDLVEEIDIGGPSLVRAAAKNFRGVIVVVDPADYGSILEALDTQVTLAFRFDLARKAFAHTAAYDAAIAAALSAVRLEGGQFGRPADASALGASVALSLEKIQDLRYGENPHQHGALYRARGLGSSTGGFARATFVQGKELSYTNLLDLDAALRIVLEFEVPAAAVIKHTNPCGVAVGAVLADAYVRARDADSLSAFGGIVALNRSIDSDTARAITSTKIDAVIATGVEEGAREILARKAAMRVVTVNLDPAALRGVELRSILGAVLAQDRDTVIEARSPWASHSLPDGFRIASRRLPSSEEWEALRFAWRVCAHVKSNSVVFTTRDQTLSVGAGQMSRVDAVNVAIMTARGSSQALPGSVAATDGFFPFRDGVDAVARAGATAVIHPGGSLRDGEVIAAADEHGLAMVLTGRRHFRH